MTMATRLADASLRVETERTGVLQQVWARRADYLYVLPAIVVMLIVIAYPIYYTIDLSFFNTPPSLQLRDKNFVGFDNYSLILNSDVFWRVTANTFIWTHRLDLDRVRPGPGSGACSEPRFRRPQRVARHPHHSMGY